AARSSAGIRHHAAWWFGWGSDDRHALEGWYSPQERRLLFRVDAVRTQRNGLVHRHPLGARLVAEASRETYRVKPGSEYNFRAPQLVPGNCTLTPVLSPQDCGSNPKTRSSWSQRQALAMRAAHAMASSREGSSNTVKPPSSLGAQGWPPIATVPSAETSTGGTSSSIPPPKT